LEIQKIDQKFSVRTSNESYQADVVILACGSSASVKDKNPYKGLDFLGQFSLPVVPVLPALVALQGTDGIEEFWAGVRTKANLSFEDFQETGELQFTKNGISGIPVMNASHLVVAALQKVKKSTVWIDFLPDFSKEALKTQFQTLQSNALEENLKVETWMRLWLPEKLGRILAKKAQIQGSMFFRDLTDTELENLTEALKHFSYEVTGYGSLSEAQVCQGGLSLAEIDEHFACKKVPGLFVTGELLNVDGICGGYNLHFAFGSGKIAGSFAGEEA